jgi:C_GCAxxG_C_C family probable redox protein
LGKQDFEVVRAMAAFAGGLGVNGEVCGALCGALAVMGLRFGRSGEDEKDDRKMWSCTLDVMKRFREEIVQSHSSIRCRDITGIDWLNRGQVTSFYLPDKIFLECTRIVGDTARLVGEILERQT